MKSVIFERPIIIGVGIVCLKHRQSIREVVWCRGIRYEIKGDIGDIIQCHCQRCRKSNGTAFATNAPINSADFKITQGEDLVKKFAVNGVTVGFVANVVHRLLARVMLSLNCIV